MASISTSLSSPIGTTALSTPPLVSPSVAASPASTGGPDPQSTIVSVTTSVSGAPAPRSNSTTPGTPNSPPPPAPPASTTSATKPNAAAGLSAGKTIGLTAFFGIAFFGLLA